MVSKAHVMAICAGDSWIDKGANLILIGGPGGGKTHLASAIGLALVENGWRVLFARTSDLVQKLQVVAFRVAPLSPCRTGRVGIAWMPSARAVRRARCAEWSALSVSCTSKPIILRL